MSPSMHRLLDTFVKWALSTKTTSPRLPAAAKIAPTRRLNQTAAQPSQPQCPPRQRGPPASIKSRRKKGRRRPSQYRNCGPDPPTNLLVQRLRSRHEPITTETWAKARLVAASTSPRQPILAHQVVLKQDEARMATSLSQLLEGDAVRWQSRLKWFAMSGIQEDDVHHWIWILEAESCDTMVDRLVSTERFKPIFVLMAILRTDHHMVKGSTLVKIYDYIARTYIAWSLESRRARKEELDLKMRGRTLDAIENMTPDHFMLLTRRLVHHCLRTFPSSLPMISRLVVDYIRVIGDWKPKRGAQRTGYAVRCLVFNDALTQFRRMPPTSSMANLPHNWKAQKILLGYSASLKRPYVLTRHTYRAIRIVLMGLNKSKDEKMTASRYAKTWPPYIRQLDGTDEARDKEVYFSRNVKAGILKQSEGYSHDLVDFALDRVGGALPGQSVSIQTRSPSFGLWRFQHRSLSIFTYWASKVRATRDAYEAWQMFNQPPLAGVTPDFHVYAEMFAKLYAMPIDEDSPWLPGDGKETFPPYLANLTDFEQERVRPCAPDELYERMIQSGQRPVHQCLSVLLSNARSVRRACQYLYDSPLDNAAVRNMTASLTPEYQHLARIPMHIFDAYLTFLCNQQGRKRWTSPNKMLHPAARERYSHVHRAIQLVSERLGPRRKPATFPWYTVMKKLAHDRLVLRPTASWAEDDVAALQAMVSLFDAYTVTQGLHPIPFDCLCRCILKVLRHKLPTLLDARTDFTAQDPKLQRLIDNARRLTTLASDMAKSAFAKLTTPVAPPRDTRLLASSPDTLPPLYHELSASHVRTYLEVLAKFGDVDESVSVVDWVLASCDPERSSSALLAKARDPTHKQWAMMHEAFVCFRATLKSSDANRALVERIEARFAELEAQGGPWSWPSREDVDEYVQWREERETLPEVQSGGGLV